MKKNVLLLLSLLLFVTVTIAGPLQTSVIDEATTYLDVGYQADNVYVEAVKIEVLSQEIFINAVAYSIATYATPVEPGETFEQKLQKRATYNRAVFNELYKYRVIPWRSNIHVIKLNAGKNPMEVLYRNPRDGLTTSLLKYSD